MAGDGDAWGTADGPRERVVNVFRHDCPNDPSTFFATLLTNLVYRFEPAPDEVECPVCGTVWKPVRP